MEWNYVFKYRGEKFSTVRSVDKMPDIMTLPNLITKTYVVDTH